MCLFGKYTYFYVLSTLNNYDAIIGFEFLKEINGIIDCKNKTLYYDGGSIELNFIKTSKESVTLNKHEIEFDKTDIPENMIREVENLLNKNKSAFASENRALPYNTVVEAEIRTNTNEPIFVKSYPYPIATKEFVIKEINTMLTDGIIEKSRSPYNSPIHVVSKKGVDEFGKPNLRLVIDFRKLNEKTISDKYPIPNILEIFSKLGKAKYFTTLDLKAGFHQIKLKESDREKTAFSVDNGKYHFLRMPFGLKNAPSIFQRAVDDVLRKYIGSFCQVYIDDIIIYSQTEQEHLKHIEIILKAIERAGMKISLEKCKFFKPEVLFLGYQVSANGLKTSPEKVKGILEYTEPKTLRALRSFLGLAGYYRTFVRNYSDIAKPLNLLLRGENGHISKTQSKNVPINFDDKAREAFLKLKEILASEDVLLSYPDMKKPLDITTDASSAAIGAVLSQSGRPITMISRTLSKTEENYATNQRELLAIFWALQQLKHYWFGRNDIRIYTDHQPLTFAMSNKNSNATMKRWRDSIEEFSPQFFYKPGKENVVADALSRQYINSITTQHSEESSSEVIRSISSPINQFKKQIFISQSSNPKSLVEHPFPNFTRNKVEFINKSDLLQTLTKIIDPNYINVFYCSLPHLALFQKDIIKHFSGTKFLHTEKYNLDITNKNDQLEYMNKEHNRAHRNAKENFKQLISEYYFPKMNNHLKEIVKNCKICLENKYQRHPPKTEIGPTPIPSQPREILHIDIFSTEGKLFLTCIDKFTKYATIRHIKSKTIVDIKKALCNIDLITNETKILVSDNEPSFKSETIRSFLRDNFNLKQHFVPTLHSESNGQIERFHSTLMEIARCLRDSLKTTSIITIVNNAVRKYNETIHSVTEEKPVNLNFNFPKEKFHICHKTILKCYQKK